jgi:hypothetical protein
LAKITLLASEELIIFATSIGVVSFEKPSFILPSGSSILTGDLGSVECIFLWEKYTRSEWRRLKKLTRNEWKRLKNSLETSGED